MNENTYHFSIGTYGGRIHGGEAPTVERSHNAVGDPFVEPDQELYGANRARMKESPVVFSMEQRLFVEKTIPILCQRGNWIYHIAACQSDHIHCLVSAHVDPKAVRRWFKTWLVQELNKKYGSRSWFVRDGSGKWVNDEQYFKNVFEYIRKQRAHRD